MRRSRPSKSKSTGSFKARAGKTNRINLSQPLRGGWRM